MNTASTVRSGSLASPRRQRGTALAVGLILLLVLTILGISGMASAALELQMSGNVQFQERAFQAAEYAIEQAMVSPDLSTAFTYSTPKVVPSSGPSPGVPGSSVDTYSYRLYYDAGAGSTSVPGGPDPGPGLETYHFVIEASGASARGAMDTHVLGFYIVGPTSLSNVSGGQPRRTYWLQKNAE
jgi:hypothetical protein